MGTPTSDAQFAPDGHIYATTPAGLVILELRVHAGAPSSALLAPPVGELRIIGAIPLGAGGNDGFDTMVDAATGAHLAVVAAEANGLRVVDLGHRRLRTQLPVPGWSGGGGAAWIRTAPLPSPQP
jgi:hypothetical protein